MKVWWITSAFMRNGVWLLLISILPGAAGCSAVGSRIVGGRYFSGVRCDYNMCFDRASIDPECRVHPVLAIVDAPFSLCGDVLFLPYDAFRDGSPDRINTTRGIASSSNDTNEFTLFKHQSRREAYEWRISEARALVVPEWNIHTSKIPIPPEKAWKLAKEWFLKQHRGEPDFVCMEIRPFDLSDERKPLGRRFYYRIECSPMQFDSMIVVVLMDGTVLEPGIIPHLRPEEVK